jgi:homoserine/homoserine lactone efflux protein
LGTEVTLETWAFFCITETLLCLNPGPSALLVISLGMTSGQAAGILATIGVLAANAVYFGLSATGLVAVHTISAETFLVIKWIGAAYLIWLGLRMIVRSFTRQRDARVRLSSDSRGRSFWQGFVTQGANPNLIVYFTAILPQFINPKAPLVGQVSILALSSFAIEFVVLSIYSAISHRAGRHAAPRFRRTIERLGGGLLIGAAVGLARLRRR